MVGGRDQVAECLSSKCKALSSQVPEKNQKKNHQKAKNRSKMLVKNFPKLTRT
jgi:hypothetical protein